MVMRKRIRRWTKDDLDRLQKVYTYIGNSLSTELTLTCLSKQAAMNEKKLNEGFSYLYGKKIKAFILQARMERAYLLLQSGDDLIKVVASNFGYKDVSSFYRAFKKYYGFAPAIIRHIEVDDCNER